MLQIFADFSGYTDIARGTARLLGFELVENFREPFLATSVSEFWRRWHISLSSWFRDYLLAPLLGDTPGRFRFAWATMVAFLVIGFWHGPSWNFALFGLYHGFWTVAQGLAARPLGRLSRIPGWQIPAIGFQLVVVGLVGSLLFREHSLARIAQHFSKDPFSASEDEWVATTVVISVTAVAAVPLLLGWAWDRWIGARWGLRPWYFPFRTSAWVGCAVALWLFWRVTAQDFVYFQF
jgi:D-alanyl-lipoteichoic acid acyltransferase DltB (MBOAT superfamily)